METVNVMLRIGSLKNYFIIIIILIIVPLEIFV